MSECTKDISWSSLVTVVTSGGDLGLLLWLNTVSAMIRMTTTTTAMTIPITITTDTVTMAMSSTEAVKVDNII